MRIKTQLLTLLFVFFSAVIFAQTPAGTTTQTPPTTLTKHQDMKHLTHDVRNERREKALRRREIKNGNAKGAVKSTRQIRRDKRAARRNAKALKASGVKHPFHRAERRSFHH